MTESESAEMIRCIYGSGFTGWMPHEPERKMVRTPALDFPWQNGSHRHMEGMSGWRVSLEKAAALHLS